MTDKLIEQIKADRDAGTPGPWLKETHHKQGYDRLVPVWYVATKNGVGVAVQPSYSDPLDEEANARRIARVPEYEARILADAEVIKAAEAKRNADAKVINAAHALVKSLKSPSHSDGESGMYHYDWFVLDQAIYAFNGAVQARAAILRSYEVPANEDRMDELWDVAQNDRDGDVTVGKLKGGE